MDVNEDFVDIAKGFIDNGVEFLVVGAYALAAHGFPRTTGDIDMFVRATPENAARVFRALQTIPGVVRTRLTRTRCSAECIAWPSAPMHSSPSGFPRQSRAI